MEDSNASHTYPATAEEYRQWRAEEYPNIPYNKCVCGCGQDAPVSPKTHRLAFSFKGELRRFIKNHNRCKPISEADYTIADRGYKTPCWIWNREIGKHGYGLVTILGSRKRHLAHRALYELYKGPIRADKELDHLCAPFGGPKCCVNPGHLEEVSGAVNVQRGVLAKLTVPDVLEIRRLYGTGNYLQREIAEIYGMSVTTIGQIVRRQCWKNV